MATCPYCSTKLLRHVRDAQIYWFCRHCWWELPLIERNVDHSSPRFSQLEELWPNFHIATLPSTDSDHDNDRVSNSSSL